MIFGIGKTFCDCPSKGTRAVLALVDVFAGCRRSFFTGDSLPSYLVLRRGTKALSLNPNCMTEKTLCWRA